MFEIRSIMCSIFRIFFTPIYLKPETVDLVVIVCCCLHNLLRDEYLSKNTCREDNTLNLEDLPTQNLIRLVGTGGFSKSEGFQVRSQFTDYFSTNHDNSGWRIRFLRVIIGFCSVLIFFSKKHFKAYNMYYVFVFTYIIEIKIFKNSMKTFSICY